MVRELLRLVLVCGALLACGTIAAQTLYKYKGEDGEWIFSDRPPDDGRQAEVRAINASFRRGGIDVTHELAGSTVDFTAANRYYAPVEVGLVFETITGVEFPHPDDDLRWVVPPRSTLELLSLPVLGTVDAPYVAYRWVYVPGDPDVDPGPSPTYRLPYSIGATFPITQTYPQSITHRTRDSMYAIDFAMPVGTDIVAARDGIVFDVASSNFKGGPDPDEYIDLANLVFIMHDDGTYAVYAHLNWNSIRVRPGDRVAAGEYIADSGNTGFSTGPHLHFAVLRNMGMRIDSLPVQFRGRSGEPIPATPGARLTAYR